MSTVKLTADLSGHTVKIHAADVDGPGRDVFDTDIPTTDPDALIHANRAMVDIARDLGGSIGLAHTPGIRYVKGVQ